MYGRSNRQLTEASNSTSKQVGPGSYERKDLQFAPKMSYSLGFAPFLSMADRTTFLDIDEQIGKTPGPAHYMPQFAFDHVKGGRSLDSKTQRFRTKSMQVPGPGTYTTSKSADWLKNRSPTNGGELGSEGLKIGSAPKTRTPIRKTGGVKFQRQSVAPSIPSTGQAYGYEETGEGFLIPHSAPEADSSMGPAYYYPNYRETHTTNKYKGCHFAALTGDRTKFEGREGPGPGDYQSLEAPPARTGLPPEPVQPTNPHPNYPIRTSKGEIPRYHELVVLESTKKAVPGPGAYLIPSQFEDNTKETEGNEERPPFGSSAPRFPDGKGKTPAPGAYDDPRTSLDTIRRLSGMKNTPFGQSAVRFKPQHHIRQTPGPGAYNNFPINSITAELSRKAILESCRKGAFGSTTPRVLPLSKKQDAIIPGPGKYEPREEPSGEYHSVIAKKKTANFVSTSKRLHSPPPIVRDIPPPGSYEVATSYDMTQGKEGSHFVGQASGPFLTTSKRFLKPKDPLPETTDPDNPGPGMYETTEPDLLSKSGKKANKASGLIVTRSKRFADIKSDVPGPGSYQFHPTVASSVLKGTYNASLDNPLHTADHTGLMHKHAGPNRPNSRADKPSQVVSVQ
eukprot:TRINITY_DN22405_c0_g1_i1.p1 TRINITY_DN22405_c0_g1~~TRINITY_DN22405_c0_g1_i1.p1  ORF type:complete len:620 (-),score=132.17 TRINITY_DN22405_c0_g1_i1:61-1920(-)